MPEGTGIWLNDSIAYASFEPARNPLDVFPGRYRLIGVCPTLVMRGGKPVVAIGVQGGYLLIPQMLMNVIDFDMDIQQAIAAPRISFIERTGSRPRAAYHNPSAPNWRPWGTAFTWDPNSVTPMA